MPIRFNCTNCKKPLKVSDQLAGRNAKCPGCKASIVIPSASTQKPPVKEKASVTKSDPELSQQKAEDIAAQAFMDEKEETEGNQTTIKFECPRCIEEIELPMSLAGKQGQCPECGRIIKVPLPEKKGKKDWRSVDTGLPTGAAPADEPPPDGAWEGRSKRVSGETLEAMGMLEEDDEPVPTRVWIRRAIIATASLGVLVVAGLFVMNRLSANKVDAALEKAMASISKEQQIERKLSPPQVAIVNLAAGQFHLNSDQINSARPEEGQNGSWNQMVQARGNVTAYLARPPFSQQCQVFLGELALAQSHLGGDSIQQRDGKRLDWQKALRETAVSIRLIPTPTMKKLALRRVARSLIQRGLIEQAVQLPAMIDPLPIIPVVSPGAPTPDLPKNDGLVNLAVVAQELARAGQINQAKTLTQQLIGVYPKKKKTEKLATPPLTLEMIATCQALLGQVPPHDPKEKTLVDQGKIVALAWQKKTTAAIQQAQTLGNEAGRFRALLGIANATFEVPTIKSANQLLQGGVKERVSPWLVFVLFQTALDAQADESTLTSITKSMKDAGLRAWCQLDLIRKKMKAASEPIDLATVKTIPAQSLAHDLALVEWAKQREASTDASDTVEEWDKSKQPFGFIGVALGLQLKKKK